MEAMTKIKIWMYASFVILVICTICLQIRGDNQTELNAVLAGGFTLSIVSSTVSIVAYIFQRF